jgi:hypothetical protein
MRAAILALLIGVPAIASAYPQFQLSTGATRCNQCHFAPAGGGLINNYGRDEAGDTISAGGNGRFLHGLWEPPSWLALGADFRVAGLISDEGEALGADTEAFPMQADLYARVAAGNFSIYGILGYRGTERASVSFASHLISREHYAMYREGSTGWYARAGRFFVPYGLRLVEHTTYVRRFLGFNTLEEPYAVSGGFIEDEQELHLSAYVPDFVRAAVGMRSSGGAAFYERRVGESAAFGVQGKFDVGDDDVRETFGAIGKLWLEGPRLQLLAEADLVHQGFKNDIGPSRWQMVGYLGAAWFFHRGFMAQLQLERWDEDLGLKGVARDAVGAEFQWFPTAHVEVGLYGRLQIIGSGSDDGTPQELVLLQIHYYL